MYPNLKNLNSDLKISTQESLKRHSLPKSLWREISTKEILNPKNLWQKISTNKSLPEESLKKDSQEISLPETSSRKNYKKNSEEMCSTKKNWGEISTKESRKINSLPKVFWKEISTQKKLRWKQYYFYQGLFSKTSTKKTLKKNLPNNLWKWISSKQKSKDTSTNFFPNKKI